MGSKWTDVSVGIYNSKTEIVKLIMCQNRVNNSLSMYKLRASITDGLWSTFYVKK